MYAIEFNTSIHNGVIRIPAEHQELYEQQIAKIFIMIDDQQANNIASQESVSDQIKKNGSDLIDFFQTSPLVSNIEMTRSREAYTNREIF
ncbi:MAG: hypothetical protein WCW84_13030 [Sulfurimonas sp.]|jgi:hypothetical protein